MEAQDPSDFHEGLAQAEEAAINPHKEWDRGRAEPPEVRDDGFGGRILNYVHKQKELDAVERAFPATHYVLVDDKLSVLTAVKRAWGDRVTTVFPRQGHYANDPEKLKDLPPADIEIASIADLMMHDFSTLPAA